MFDFPSRKAITRVQTSRNVDISRHSNVHISVVRHASVRLLGAGSTTGTVHADMTLTRSKVKIKVTGLLNFRKLAKPCIHAGGDNRQPPSGDFGSIRSSPDDTTR